MSGQPIHHQTEVWWFSGRLNISGFEIERIILLKLLFNARSLILELFQFY